MADSDSDSKEDEAVVFDGLQGVSDELQAIARGLRIVSMSMRDGEAPERLWEDKAWSRESMWCEEKTAVLPSRILDCLAVARTVEFSSEQAIPDLRLVQRMLLNETEVERMSFMFGFVIPGSTNTWEQTIVSAPKDQMLPASVMSGNLVVESTFFSGDSRLGSTRVRIVYE